MKKKNKIIEEVSNKDSIKDELVTETIVTTSGSEIQVEYYENDENTPNSADELLFRFDDEEVIESVTTNEYKSRIEYWSDVNKPIMAIFFSYFNQLSHKRMNENTPIVDGIELRGILNRDNAFIDNLTDFPAPIFDYTILLNTNGNDIAFLMQAYKESGQIRNVIRMSSSNIDNIKSQDLYTRLFKLALDASNLKGSYMTIGDNKLEWKVRELKDLSFEDVFLPKLLMDDLSIYTKLFDSRQILQRYMFSGIPGTGKAQPLTSKILTPNGWTTMGEIQVGDEVLTPNGDVTKIIGVYPQGIKEIYRLNFKDGKKTEACGEHLWEVYGFVENGKRVWSIKTTNELIHALNNTKYKLKTKLIKSFDIGETNDYIIPPYLLGLLLGDGSFNEYSLKLTTSDDDIVNDVTKLLDEKHQLVYSSNYDYLITRVEGKGTKYGDLGNTYVKEIRTLELSDKRSDTKFIPEKYFMGSLDDRLNLIQGLIDSYGTVDNSGSMSYSTVSEKLSKDIQRLIWSIGGIAKISERYTHYTYKGEKKRGKLSYNIQIRYPEQKKLVKLERKLSKLSENYQYKDTLKNEITSIDYIGEKEAQCIMIEDEDHLYVTDDYIVTHNTESTRAISKILNNKGVTIIKTNICEIIKQKFELAAILAPSLIILDDIDLYLGDRNHTGVSNLLGQFLDILDGVDKLPDNVGVIASTNAPHLIDLAAQRPGRFNKLIFFDDLTEENIKSIIHKSLNSMNEDYKNVSNEDRDTLTNNKLVTFFKKQGATGAFIFEAVKAIKHKQDIMGGKIDLDVVIKELKTNGEILEKKLQARTIKNKLNTSGGGGLGY